MLNSAEHEHSNAPRMKITEEKYIFLSCLKRSDVVSMMLKSYIVSIFLFISCLVELNTRTYFIILGPSIVLPLYVKLDETMPTLTQYGQVLLFYCQY